MNLVTKNFSLCNWIDFLTFSSVLSIEQIDELSFFFLNPWWANLVPWFSLGYTWWLFIFFSIYCYLKDNYCVDFCHTSTWISHRYTCPLFLGPPSHPIPPLYVITESRFELPKSNSKFALTVCFTNGGVYVSMLLSLSTPTSPSWPMPWAHKSVAMCLSLLLPCKQIH